MKKEFGGVYPALLTPFDENDKINFNSLEKLVEYNLKKGVHGFYVDGSTAEAFLLTFEERKEILKTVSECAKGKCNLIAQIGCIGTKMSVELAQYAESLGYDAVSSVAPFYYKFGFEEIKKYYFDIVNSVNIPMVIYNIPAYSGVTLSADNIGEFLSDDRFIGVKHTATDYFALRQFKRAFPDKTIFNGFDETFLAGLSMGADGAIGSTFNFMAEKFIRIFELFKNNDVAAAQKIQNEADVIIEELCKVGVMQGEKAILDELGIKMGNVRAPFKPISDENRKYIVKKVMPLL